MSTLELASQPESDGVFLNGVFTYSLTFKEMAQNSGNDCFDAIGKILQNR